MSKLLKTILLISLMVLGIGFLAVSSANAISVSPLVIEYSSDGGSTWLPLSGPIFSENNFMPGQDVVRLIRVRNYSGQNQRIAAEAINKNDPDEFSSQLNLSIKEDPTIIFNNTLKQFFNQGETYLSTVATGNQAVYNFTINFNSGAGDEYQGKILGFDILVGFEGADGGIETLPTGGGGGGGELPPGLTITNETYLNVKNVSVTITWFTNYNSSSQVIYGAEGENHTLDLNDNTGSPPKYGYAYTTSEYNIDPKVTLHSVTITGLTPGTKYYYRAVSHASLAISQEYTFNTLTSTPSDEEKNQQENSTNLLQENGGIVDNNITTSGVPSQGEKIADNSGNSENSITQVNSGTNLGNPFSNESQNKKADQGSLGNFFGGKELLAAIGSFFNLQNIGIILIILVVVLVVLYFLVWKKKKD